MHGSKFITNTISKKKEKLKIGSMKSRAGAAQIYEPKLWCYDQLLFLGEGGIHRESTSTQDDSTAATDEQVFIVTLEKMVAKRNLNT